MAKSKIYFQGLLCTTTLDGLEYKESDPTADLARFFLRLALITIGFVLPIMPLVRLAVDGFNAALELLRRENLVLLGRGDVPYIVAVEGRLRIDEWLVCLDLDRCTPTIRR